MPTPTWPAPLALAAAGCLALAGCAAGGQARDGAVAAIDVPAVAHPAGETPQWWYRSGAARAAANGAMAGRARNVIVFLGDGMSLTTVAAARILDGQRAGGSGEEHQLAFERFPATALSKTYNTDSQTPDSAGTMTAIASGVKSHRGAIGVSAGLRESCADSRGKALASWLALGRAAGLGAGIVTTARLTHATPAALYAHVPDRNWENDADLTEEARAAGCADIASQLVDAAKAGLGPHVALGGGRAEFQPVDQRDVELDDKVGHRLDGRDLVAEWRAAMPGAAYAWNRAQLEGARGAPAVLGLFEYDHLQYAHDRDRGENGDPDLPAMTRFAIEALAKHRDGYVLLVEGGRIDHANHEGNAFRALDETTEFSRAVQAAVDATSADDTLIVVTADHSHVLGFAGYPQRGNPILGKVRGISGEDGDGGDYALDALGLPYTTLAYLNGAGYAGASNEQPAGPKRHLHKPSTFEPQEGRPNLADVDTEHADYMQEALIPMKAETHGGDDVGVWARGPGSAAFRGTIEQNVLYHLVVQATPALRAQLCALGTCNADGVPVDLPDPAALRAPAAR